MSMTTSTVMKRMKSPVTLLVYSHLMKKCPVDQNAYSTVFCNSGIIAMTTPPKLRKKKSYKKLPNNSIKLSKIILSPCPKIIGRFYKNVNVVTTQ